LHEVNKLRDFDELIKDDDFEFLKIQQVEKGEKIVNDEIKAEARLMHFKNRIRINKY